MAILTGINTKLRGSAGNWTFARLNGQTVAKEKLEKKAVPVRTLKQMNNRMQWANLVNLYSAFSGTLHPSFENKPPTRSDYNMFMSANLNANPVYLTSSQARQGGCLVAAYQITRGKLPGVHVEFGNNNVPESDIGVGSLTLGNSTTLKAFSDAIIENNSSWRNGDQLSVYVAHQLMDSETGVPRVEINAIEVTLDTYGDTTMLSDIVETSFFAVVDGCLALSGPVNGGVAFVHSRIVNGKTSVSSQFFVVNNNYLAQYQTSAAFSNAIKSYGGINKDDFLTPNIDDVVQMNP